MESGGSAVIQTTWGSGEKPRYTVALADGSEIQALKRRGEYTFNAGQQFAGRLEQRSKFMGPSEYDLELAADADQVLIVATGVVIAPNRRLDPQTEVSIPRGGKKWAELSLRSR